MPEATIAPYGSWRSDIRPQTIATATLRLGDIAFEAGSAYWCEGRASEAGRGVIVVRRTDGTTADITPPNFDVGTRAHEYGGGAFTVHRGTVYFSNKPDGRIYRQAEGGTPEAVTRDVGMRYADLRVHPTLPFLVAVREDHTAGHGKVVNTLVAVHTNDGSETVIVSGNDFYSSPRLSPDGQRIAWTTWNHPNMPWDGSELWTARMSETGTASHERLVAGGPEESIFQPEWAPDGTLHFSSDRTGLWNVYRERDGKIETVTVFDGEVGRAQWVFGMSSYGFTGETTLVCVLNERNVHRLVLIDTLSGEVTPVDTPYTVFEAIATDAGRALALASSPLDVMSVVAIDLPAGNTEVIRRSSDLSLPLDRVSIPRAIEFPTGDGHTAYAFYYPPHNPAYVAPHGELPPLIVASHGGPTSAAVGDLSPQRQFWTSRGFGYLDVNYSGSTGYGRDYRKRLNGQWGILDVNDCIAGAKYLAERGTVDPARLAIRGGSAGGYTTLCALTFHDAFAAGVSQYGVADAEALARDTHKFESHYTDSLIAPYPEGREVYVQRSPVHFVDRISCPVLLLQGLDDRVVPPAQAEAIFEALRRNGQRVAYVPFEGEGHGFRRSDTIARCLELELSFYSQIFDFTPADDIPAVDLTTAGAPS